MDLNRLIIFKKIAELGSFSAAAKSLGQLKSSISQKMNALEQDLGVRLLQRTTRRVSLTEIGERVYDAVQRISNEVDEIRSLSASIEERPRGLLRVTAPHDLGVYVMERVLPIFRSDYPEVDIEMDLSNRFVDLVAEEFDVAIRATTSPLQESSLIAQSFLTTSSKLYASPLWLQNQAELTQPDDLQNTDAIVFAPATQRRKPCWRLTHRSGDEVTVPVRAALRTNDYLAIKRAALQGFGVAVLPEIICLDEVEAGALVPLCPEWTAARSTSYTLYPSRRYLPAKTRVFLKVLRDLTSRDQRRCTSDKQKPR